MNRYIDINGEQLQEMLAKGQNVTVVDVRNPVEYDHGHIPQAVLKPLSEIGQWIEEFSPTEQLVLVCASGSRSSTAASELNRHGFTRVYNLRGGMAYWPFQVAK